MNKRWYVVRSKPKREGFAAGQLARAGIETYLPYVRVHREHGKAAVPEPFFTGYFFGRLDAARAELHLAKYTPGVLYVVGYGEEAWPVPDALIEEIRQRLARGRGQGAREQFRAGERVVVTSGPLAGVEAIFDCHLSATGRARVFIGLLQRLCRAELRIEQLRRIPQAAGIAGGS